MNENISFRIKCRAIILHDGKMLVANHGAEFYALPGGHLEWNETPIQCIEREVFEELGVKAKIGRLLYINTFIHKQVHFTEFFYEVTNGADFVGFEKLERSHAFEIAKTQWISPADNINLRPARLAEDFREGKVLSDEIRYSTDNL